MLFIISLLILQNVSGQFYNAQYGMNTQGKLGYNLGFNVSEDFFTTSENKLFGSSLQHIEGYVLLEKNTALNSNFYPVLGLGYEYFRKTKKVGREYASRTGLGINIGANFKTFNLQGNRINQMNGECALTWLGVLYFGYGRTLISSFPDQFKTVGPDYFFIRLSFGTKTFFTVIDLGGGWV